MTERRNGDAGRRDSDCDPIKCGMQQKLEKVMDRFSQIAEDLKDNQVEMRLTLQRLVDQYDFVEKLDKKLDRVEGKADENSKLVWKLVGIATAVSLAIPYVFRHVTG